jgi:hypothetical protein
VVDEESVPAANASPALPPVTTTEEALKPLISRVASLAVVESVMFKVSIPVPVKTHP